jgi:hypothetical protein
MLCIKPGGKHRLSQSSQEERKPALQLDQQANPSKAGRAVTLIHLPVGALQLCTSLSAPLLW